jgi:hypothetical protein
LTRSSAWLDVDQVCPDPRPTVNFCCMRKAVETYKDSQLSSDDDKRQFSTGITACQPPEGKSHRAGRQHPN